jgi:hypothetical protein
MEPFLPIIFLEQISEKFVILVLVEETLELLQLLLLG